MDARSIAFGLGPRLNAAGRLGKPDAGLHLLTATDLSEARKLAQDLDEVNHQRQEIQKWTQEEADYLFEREIDLERDRVIVLASENFHGGVIGIVAARLAQTHFRPTVLIALKDGMGKGSARSIPAFNLFRAFRECSSHLTQYGGHAYAAGLNIEDGEVPAFREAINKVGHRILSPERLIPELTIDGSLPLESLTFEQYRELQSLEPYGQGNPIPLFMTPAVTIRGLQFMGREGRHARFRATRGDLSIEVVGFHMRETFEALETGAVTYDLAGELQINNWNGREKLQFKLLDLRPSTE